MVYYESTARSSVTRTYTGSKDKTFLMHWIKNPDPWSLIQLRYFPNKDGRAKGGVGCEGGQRGWSIRKGNQVYLKE